MPTPIVIPARLGARRLPGKPLAEIGGAPMIVRVLRCAQAARIGPVLVAAGDPEIVEAVRAAGGEAVATDPTLPSGSDRCLAAIEAFDPQRRFHALINLQGDMPFVAPAILIACAALLEREPACDLATVVTPEASPADRANPDVVKAIVALGAEDRSGRALWFTRSTLFGEGPIWRHVGIYGWRREALARFAAAPPSPLEKRENLEQLRALEMGMSVFAAVAETAPLSVDTPADLAGARRVAREAAA